MKTRRSSPATPSAARTATQPPHSLPRTLESNWVWILAPAVLFLVLAAPTARFAFMLDDYNFMDRARTFGMGQLLPDSQFAFYRPLSRELYFWLLYGPGGSNPLWGHLINATVVAAAIAITTALCQQLVGKRAGLLSGMWIASLGAMPFLAAWVSCSQDALPMLFLSAALIFQLRDKLYPAVACTAAALLSKETTLFFIPGLATMGMVLKGERVRVSKSLLTYIGLVLLWVAVHPRLHTYLTRGFATGEGGYVGLDNPDALKHAGLTVGSLFNLPVLAGTKPWPGALTGVALAGVALLALTMWFYRPRGEKDHSGFPRRRILTFGILLGGIPALVTAISVKHWTPYYICLPAMGFAPLIGLLGQRLPTRIVPALAAIFLLLGVWYRGSMGEDQPLTEGAWRVLSERLTKVEAQLKKLHPSFPDSARLFVSTHLPRNAKIHAHLVNLQASRTWYPENTPRTAELEQFDVHAGPSFIFWISPASDVFEIKVPSLRARSPGGRPDYREYQKAIRGLALGLFRAGEVDSAANLLQRMPELDSLTWAFDQRLAATLYFAAGRHREAAQIRDALPPIRREESIASVIAVLGPEVPGLELDNAAFFAYGLDPRDPEPYREMMFYYSDREELLRVEHMASRLLALRPGDADATFMLEEVRKIPKWEQILAPVRGQTQ